MNKTLETLIKNNETTIEHTMVKFLRKAYGEDNVIYLKNYFILAVGKLPIGLVAHMDTVLDNPPSSLEERGSIISATDGLGADDRAGIYAIVKLITQGYRPYVILTQNEELGGIGAKAMAKCIEDIPLKYLIQLDRRGKEDAVFYDCPNEKFKKYILPFGFKEERGIYSDISFLCPPWNIAGVNLSVGYFYEHTEKEFLNTEILENTIKKVAKMLDDVYNIDYFTYWEE